MFVVMSKNRQITGHYSVAHRAVTGLSYLGNETRKNAGPSREWRPEGAPTTDEALLVLL